jgi:hypothetical protein
MAEHPTWLLSSKSLTDQYSTTMSACFQNHSAIVKLDNCQLSFACCPSFTVANNQTIKSLIAGEDQKYHIL